MKPILQFNLAFFLFFVCTLAVAQNKNVTGTKENHAPVFIKEMPDTTPNLNRLYKFIYQATDSDGDAIKYFPATNLPSGAHLDSISGEFSWTPSYEHVGKYEISINATDGKLTTASRKTKISVVSYGSYANQITVTCNPVSGGRSSNILCNVGDTVSAKAWSNPGYRFMSWTENNVVVSKDSFYTFIVTANRNLVANFRINHAPVFIKEMPDTLIICGRNYIYTYKATDPDGDSLKFFPKTVLPQNCILLSSGVFGWRPFYAQNGIHEISVYVTDGDLTANSKVAKVNVMCISDVSEKETIPLTYSLSQNYPNPFNPETTIEYSIPVKTRHASSLQKVTLKVFDLLGREVATLVDEYKQAGTYNEIFNVKTRHGASLQSGIYFYRLQSGSFVQTKKMILLK